MLFLVVLILWGCSPKIRNAVTNSIFEKLDENTEVIVLDSVTPVHDSILVGKLKIGDTGFTTDCGYNKIINDAKTQARKFGGNIIQITELKRPIKWESTCYRIKANILRSMDEQVITKLRMVSFKNKESPCWRQGLARAIIVMCSELMNFPIFLSTII